LLIAKTRGGSQADYMKYPIEEEPEPSLEGIKAILQVAKKVKK
jgi:hypothetical protein